MSLKDKLLESYITASLNPAPVSFQDLGRRFCRHPGNSLQVMKEAFGESCRRYGQMFFEANQPENVQAALSGIQEKIVSESVKSAIDFSAGMHNEMQRQGMLFLHSGAAIMRPDIFHKELSDEFMRRLNERDIPGILDLYSRYDSGINRVYADAKEFIEFLKTIQ